MILTSGRISSITETASGRKQDETKLPDSAYYQYDGDQLIADLDGAGAVTALYTRLPDGRILSEY